MPKPRAAVVTRVDQMRVLASPIRLELVNVLSRSGALSLIELGSILGRPADGLYYHVRLLSRAGLVHSAGVRKRRGQREELFQARARLFKLSYAPASTHRTRAMQAIVTSVLRLGIRDYRRASADLRNAFEGPARDVWALRAVGWLRPSQVIRINRLIRGIVETTERTEPKGRLYAVTVLLTPLDYRASVSGRRPRRGTPG